MTEVVVSGVGGPTSGPAEANLLGSELLDIVASAAFRLRVVGGMVSQVELLVKASDEH